MTRAARMTADERRSAIIDAVVPLLRAHGPDLTTRQVAAAAGIAEGTIFRVFPDKRALLLATAQQTVNPADGREQMALVLAAIPDLRDKILAVVEQLVETHDRVMVVMTALRPILLEAHRACERPGPPGPPAFMVESNRVLLRNLTELLFEPHAAQLRVPPKQAALVLRSLVFGAWHPGMAEDDRLGAGDLADAVLHGVAG